MSASARKPRTISDLASAQQAAERSAFAADQQLFPHTKADYNTTSLVHFLPDADEDNALLYVEQRDTMLPFYGAIGGDQETEELVSVKVPNLETWGLIDPITAFLKPYWKQHKDWCRIYYRSSSYWYSCFVTSTPIIEPSLPTNPIRKLRFTKSLHDRVNWCLDKNNCEFEIDPSDFDEGRDFRLVKVKKGEFADWSNSGFSSKARSLTEVERGAIDTNGLINLADLIPQVPDKTTRKLIFQMFEDSTALKPFDQDKYPMFRAWPSMFGKAPQEVPGSTSVQVRTPNGNGAASVAATMATNQATMDQLRAKNRSSRGKPVEDVPFETADTADEAAY